MTRMSIGLSGDLDEINCGDLGGRICMILLHTWTDVL
jgi:hypothetical protein